jgi:hypothetical protein
MKNTIIYKMWRVGLLDNLEESELFFDYQEALDEYNETAYMFDNVKLIEMEVTEVHEW